MTLAGSLLMLQFRTDMATLSYVLEAEVVCCTGPLRLVRLACVCH